MTVDGSDSPDPARTSLTDQAQASEDHLRRGLGRSRERRGATRTTGGLTGGRAQIYGRLREGLAAGQIRVCRHIDPVRPQRQAWLAWSPAEISCLPCARAASPAHTLPCDLCGTAVARLVVLTLPAIVDPNMLAASGATMVMTFLCGGCDQG
jgi:hypothetical protein